MADRDNSTTVSVESVFAIDGHKYKVAASASGALFEPAIVAQTAIEAFSNAAKAILLPGTMFAAVERELEGANVETRGVSQHDADLF